MTSPSRLNESPSIRPVPFRDQVFVRFVDRCLASLAAEGIPTVDALESRLRQAFPHAVVRRTELDGPHQHAWYAYREGSWVPPRDATWWEDVSLPRLSLDAAGFIWEASEAAADFLCAPPSQLVGRHFTDFALADPMVAVPELRTACVEDGICEAAGELRRVSGDVMTVEYVLQSRPDGGSCVTFRPLVSISPQPWRLGSELPAIDCEPASDRLFAAYARVVAERMPEPAAAGVELRLRRLYPRATVSEADGRLVCRRDDWREPPDRWWSAANLPQLVFDRQSLIHRASPELVAALGIELVGRFWQEFTVGQGPDEAEATQVLFELGGTETIVALSGPGGGLDMQAHIERSGELMVATLAPAAALRGDTSPGDAGPGRAEP